MRIDAFRHKRTLSLLVADCALLAAISFVTFITRSISGPLRQQAADLQSANAELQAQIAERERAENELRHSEAQLAAAQKVARIGSWELELRNNNERFQKALQEKSPFSFEHRIIRQDGQERVLSIDRQVEKMFGTAQDITERRHAEEQLEKAHNYLLDVSRRAGMAEVATGVLHKRRQCPE